MRFRTLCSGALAALLLLTAPGALYAQNQAAADSAKQAAQEWLTLLDADDYEATWTEASSFFRSKVGSDQWVQRIQQAHSTLDSLQSRSLVAARYTTSLPNAPAGKYVIAQYRATYGSEETVETVSLKKEQDEWRVAGYVIRPAKQ
jgi:hypothetical protein